MVTGLKALRVQVMIMIERNHDNHLDVEMMRERIMIKDSQKGIRNLNVTQETKEIMCLINALQRQRTNSTLIAMREVLSTRSHIRTISQFRIYRRDGR